MLFRSVFRRGGDVSFVVEELKAVFDPRGGQWMDGRYVPSLLAAIGAVLETHMIDIGFMLPEGAEAEVRVLADGPSRQGGARLPPACPRCGQFSLIHQEGCNMCTSCGYSKCA